MDTFMKSILEANLTEDLIKELNEVTFEFQSWYKNSLTYAGKTNGKSFVLHLTPEYRDNLYSTETIKTMEFIEPENLTILIDNVPVLSL